MEVVVGMWHRSTACVGHDNHKVNISEERKREGRGSYCILH